jgi:hypothetical protein
MRYAWSTSRKFCGSGGGACFPAASSRTFFCLRRSFLSSLAKTKRPCRTQPFMPGSQGRSLTLPQRSSVSCGQPHDPAMIRPLLFDRNGANDATESLPAHAASSPDRPGCIRPAPHTARRRRAQHRRQPARRCDAAGRDVVGQAFDDGRVPSLARTICPSRTSSGLARKADAAALAAHRFDDAGARQLMHHLHQVVFRYVVGGGDLGDRRQPVAVEREDTSARAGCSRKRWSVSCPAVYAYKQ